MIEVGRLAVKIAGRDANKKCVIVNILDDRYILIDGETRRRRCNIMHIEPLDKTIKLRKNASHDAVAGAFKEIGLEARQTKPKEKKERPRRKRKTPEQLRVQKEEKRKLREIFTKKKEEVKKEEAGKEETLEEKAGIEAKDEKEKGRGLKITPTESEEKPK